MLAEIREILIISTPQDISRLQELVGDGKQFGISLSHAIQQKREGLAQAREPHHPCHRPQGS